jgi:galactose oxidase
MAAQATPRIYHATTVLLPDGRVLSAGMDNGSYQFTGEIFSPPYLFKGPRPTITSAPSSLGYNQAFQIATPDAGDVQRVALMKPGSATHSIDSEQRYVDLSFTAGDGDISATSPSDGNKAPPGWYMLFIVSSSGVPSVASWVKLT